MSGPPPLVELGTLGFDQGAHVLLAEALRTSPDGVVRVRGGHPDLPGGMAACCRRHGHRIIATAEPATLLVERGRHANAAWIGAVRAGDPDPSTGLVERPPAEWGLAARGAAVEPGGPAPRFPLDRQTDVWTERAPDLYRAAAAGQWSIDELPWGLTLANAPVIERAVVQVMTFLIENEMAALVIPARFLAQVHPHFREVQQVLALTTADEARHVEAFTRRARLGGEPLGLSTVGGRASLQTLIEEPDFAIASFLLSAMGEGTFVTLLGFLERHAPDELTRTIADRVRQDEARHVAFAMSHLARHVELEPSLRGRLAASAERRHEELRTTNGLNDEVFDSLVLLAAGSTDPEDIRSGWRAVQELQVAMAEGRAARLGRLGFSPSEAEEIAALHTRNFM